jgi:hypothetical protein
VQALAENFGVEEDEDEAEILNNLGVITNAQKQQSARAAAAAVGGGGPDAIDVPSAPIGPDE